MSEVPDKVIGQASAAGTEAAELARGGVVERGRARDRAFAQVIAGWARAEGAAEERARIASRVRAELIPESEHDGSPAGPLGDSITDQAGTIDLGDCLTVDIAEGIARWIEALDRDGSADTREDGK